MASFQAAVADRVVIVVVGQCQVQEVQQLLVLQVQLQQLHTMEVALEVAVMNKIITAADIVIVAYWGFGWEGTAVAVAMAAADTAAVANTVAIDTATAVATSNIRVATAGSTATTTLDILQVTHLCMVVGTSTSFTNYLDFEPQLNFSFPLLKELLTKMSNSNL